ncbi:MAG: DNA-directed RNA polymerase subunit alpha [Pseudopedobacter sp.]|nr:DNA-directed RNA polymerase subunit alpha [Deinococcales bacterium]
MENRKPQLKARIEGNYGEFTLEPLARGYGVTLGNPLRRILLSSIPGTAVTSVYIEDVLHEFSTIPGVTEDVIQIILNLKEMVVKFHQSGPKTLTLRATGPKTVTAADFEVPLDAEVVNGNQYIATLGEGGKLIMEVRVEEGEGYVPADKHATKDRINSIPVDAIYTPVRRVAYHVEDTRVGQQTDLDRLIIRVWTDGSVEPKAALDRAVELMRGQLSVFSDGVEQVLSPILPSVVAVQESPQPVSTNINPEPFPDSNPPRVTLEGLGLTTRVLHSLKEEGIDSVDALLALSDRDLKKVPGIGERSLDEIKAQLAQYGLILKD